MTWLVVAVLVVIGVVAVIEYLENSNTVTVQVLLLLRELVQQYPKDCLGSSGFGSSDSRPITANVWSCMEGNLDTTMNRNVSRYNNQPVLRSLVLQRMAQEGKGSLRLKLGLVWAWVGLRLDSWFSHLPPPSSH
eukprot:704945-Rhodomonas_salina.1